MSVNLAPAALGLLQEQRCLRQAHFQGAGSRETARGYADAVDAAVLSLLPDASPKQPWALVALGGYGRRELSPRSDVDIMVLSQRHDKSIEGLANTVFYGLWDAGLEVGHSVLTIEECLRLANEYLPMQTSLIDARLVAGQSALFENLQARLFKEIGGSKTRPFLQRLWKECERRHREYGEADHQLEPHLKEGQGGLRDYHSILWAGAAAGISRPERPVQGLISEREAAAVDAAVSFLCRVRHHLHYLSERRTDQLFFSYQEEVAQFLGYTHSPDRLAVERFMRDLYEHLDTIWQATTGFWEQILEFSSGGKAWHLKSETPVARPWNPDAALQVFAEAVRHGTTVRHAQCQEIRAGLEDARAVPVWTAQARSDFLEILRSDTLAVPLLEAMANCGLLSLYIPAWSAIRFLALHEVYHVHTVDHHCLLAVAEINRARGDRAEDADPLAKQLLIELPNADLLLLATLIHDLGKAQGEDHCEEGAHLAEDVGKRAGLTPPEIEIIIFLVRHHLLLARVATRRDIDDQGLITRVAQTIESPEKLKMLYILTVADSLATGPGAWTDWKGTLVRELFGKVLRVLEGDRAAYHDAAGRLAEKREAVRVALAARSADDAAEDFLTRMPPAYLRSQSISAIVRHFALLSQASDGPVRLHIRRLSKAHRYEVILSTVDRPGLLWRICGVLALHGLNILEARVYTGDKDLVLDVFQVADAFEPQIRVEKLEAIQRDIVLAVEGKLALSYRLAEKLRYYSRPKPAVPKIQTRVVVDNAASDDYTVVEVFAPDRLGLLYTITRTLSDMHLDIHLAKVSTRGHEAIDAFYVRDLYGQKVTDSEHLSETEKTILFELGREV